VTTSDKPPMTPPKQNPLDKLRDELDRAHGRNVVPFAPPEAYDEDGARSDTEASKAKGKAPMDWAALASQTPPERAWAIDHWLGMGHVTMLSGAGGLGKTSVAQALGSCIATGRDYLDNVAQARNVLMWACEDDESELWRRQIAISDSLGAKLADFSNFNLMSYDGEDVELCCLRDGVVAQSPMLEVLRQQIGDYRAGVVILDNIARLYGCSENDRHQVTTFMAALTNAARSTGAAVLLLGHPAKAAGSEYSGSTAWEGAARARLYLGRTLPDQEQQVSGELQADDGVRYLSRRKANYTTRDYRRITYKAGVMIPDDPPQAFTTSSKSAEFNQDTVIRAVLALERMGKWGNASTNSPDYLPKIAESYSLTDGMSRKAFATAMRDLEIGGRLRLEVVGQYQNRTPKMGLKVCTSADGG
jgi:RecA-family ATPase